MMIDNNLSWNYHIDYLTTKLAQVAGIMYKIRKNFSMESRLLIYNSLAASYLQYGILAWGCASSTTLSRLQTLQNRIVRYMTYSPPHTNLDSKYKSLKILKVNELYSYEQSKFVHSIFNNYSPNTFQDYFQTINHSYGTRARRNNNYALPQPRTERGKKSIKFSGVVVWTNIPESFKSLSKTAFKFELKQHILRCSV